MKNNYDETKATTQGSMVLRVYAVRVSYPREEQVGGCAFNLSVVFGTTGLAKTENTRGGCCVYQFWYAEK